MKSAAVSILVASLFCLSAPAADSPVVSTGTAPSTLASFDKLMTSFVRDRGLPGAALAVGRKGTIVYARGFGWADREAKRAVQPDSLFRIPSVPKPITAVAVLQLGERGILKLDDSVFDLLRLKAPLRDF